MVGMLAILLTWILAHIVFTGIGVLILLSVRLRVEHSEDYLRAFWLGLGVVIMILQIWNFVFPVNDLLRVCLFIAGLAGYGLWLRNARHFSVDRHLWIAFLFLSIVAIWLANQALLRDPDVDDGLYRLQVVRWFSEYRVVPGLGNLHDRLAFSNGFFYYPALYNTGFWLHRVSYVSSGLLYWMITATFVISLVQWSRENRSPIFRYGHVLLVLIMLREATGTGVYTISNDTSTMLLGYLVLGYTWQYLEQATDLSEKQSLYHLFVIVLLVSIGIAAKFSFIVFGPLLAVIALLARVVPTRFNRVILLRSVAICVLASMLILLPMAIRSVIQTGYVLYPMTSFGSIPTEWQVSAEVGESTVRWIAAWGRVPNTPPDEILNNMDWFSEWWQILSKNTTLFRFPVFLTALGIGGTIMLELLQATRKPRPSIVHTHTKILYGMVFIGNVVALVFWFVTSPNLRFLGAVPYALAFSALMLFFLSLPTPQWRKLCLFTLCLTFSYLIVRNFGASGWQTPYPKGDFIPQITAHPSMMTTNSGLSVFVPSDSKCWSHEVPCANRFNPDLATRKANDLQSGFIIHNP